MIVMVIVFSLLCGVCGDAIEDECGICGGDELVIMIVMVIVAGVDCGGMVEMLLKMIVECVVAISPY